MVLNKYGLALIQFVYIVVIALQTARTMEQNASTLWQFAAVVVGAAFTVGLKLIENAKWHAGLKVASAIVAAAFTAIIPLAMQTWTIDNILIVVLAVVNAFVVQFGVDARIDGFKAAIADPDVNTKAAIIADPSAAAVAMKQLENGHWSTGLDFGSNINSGQHRKGN